MRRLYVVSLLVLLGTVATSEAATITVDTCGQVVSGTGMLIADLDCSGFPDDAVIISKGKLDLHGFTITGGMATGVRCVGNCTIESSTAPGIIRGAVGNGILLESLAEPGQVVSGKFKNIQVLDNGTGGSGFDFYGIGGWKMKAINIVVAGNGGGGIFTGVFGQFGAKLVDSLVENNGGVGVFGRTLKIRTSSIISNAGNGLDGRKVKTKTSIVSNNGASGIEVNLLSASIRDTIISENGGAGISASNAKVVLKEATVEMNGSHGVSVTGSVTASNSTISGNGGSGVAVVGGKANLKRTTIRSNAIGVEAERAKVVLVASEIRDNALFGIDADSTSNDARGRAPVTVKGSLIIDNGIDPACGIGPVVCADIASDEEPKFEYIVGVNECEYSYVRDSGFPGASWGICEFDCGNGVINAGEACDDAGESPGCDIDCTEPSCGDGTLNMSASEQCDDGNTISEDGCNASCVTEFCGDGTVQGGLGETCDDGNTTSDDGCNASCVTEFCGDGTVQGGLGETCDDGNTTPGDGCDASCQAE